MKPKILMISSLPPSKDGAAIYSYELINALSRIGVNITCLSNVPAKDSCIRQTEKCWSYSSITYPFTMLKEALKQHYNIIHIQHEFFLYGYGFSATYILLPLLVLRFLRRKIVITMHQVFPTSKINNQFMESYLIPSCFPAGFIRLFIKFFVYLLCFCASAIIVHLESMKQTLISEYHVKDEKIVVIPHGVHEYPPITINEKEFAKKRLGLTGRNIVLFFGFITPRKGLEKAILAVHKLIQNHPNILLLIVGTPPERSGVMGKRYLLNLKSLVKQLKLNNHVRFVGFIPEDEIPTYFLAADALILPYIDCISVSGTFKLANAFQIPVISTDLDYIREETFQSGVKQCLVRSGDYLALANAIDSLYKQPANLSTAKHNPHFTWKDAAKMTLTLYLTLLKR